MAAATARRVLTWSSLISTSIRAGLSQATEISRYGSEITVITLMSISTNDPTRGTRLYRDVNSIIYQIIDIVRYLKLITWPTYLHHLHLQEPRHSSRIPLDACSTWLYLHLLLSPNVDIESSTRAFCSHLEDNRQPRSSLVVINGRKTSVNRAVHEQIQWDLSVQENQSSPSRVWAMIP